MGLKNINLFISLLVCLIKYEIVISQTRIKNIDSILPITYNKSLIISKLELNKPLVLISETNCVGCVNYFTSKKGKFNYLVFLQNKSIVEAELKIKILNLPKNDVIFANIPNLSFDVSKSPCFVIKNTNGVFFLDYLQTNILTEEFGLESKKLSKKISTIN